MAASLLPDSTSCFFPCPLPFLFSSVPFLLTYLSCSPSQVIIPMAALTRLGYEVKWTGSGCKINSPDGAQLPVRLDQGCPTLPRREGVGILQQVEDQQRRETEMKLAAIRPSLELPKACPEVEAVKILKSMFPEVPADLAKEIPGFAEVDMNQVIFNRHH